MKSDIQQIEDLLGFYEDMHSCDDERNLELPDGLGKGCEHILSLEMAWKRIKTKLK